MDTNEHQEDIMLRSTSPDWAVQNHKYESGQDLAAYKKKNANYFKNSEHSSKCFAESSQ